MPLALHIAVLRLSVAGAGMLVFLVFADRARALLGHLSPARSVSMRTAVTRLQGFLEDLSRVGSWRVLGAGLALAAIKRGLEVAAAFALQLACGISADPVAPILVVAAVSLNTLVPITPANLGTHSAGVFAAFVLVGVPRDMALATGLLHHGLVFVSSGAMALVGLGLSRA